MTALVIPQQKQNKMKPQNVVRLWLALMVIFFAALGVMAPAAPVGAQAATCTDGLDAAGDPCLDIQADSLMAEIFRWANIIIPVLLPLVAIGIGIQFGGNILGGIKNFFGSFRLG